MSNHTTTPAAAVTSPKVKAAGVWGAVIVGALIVVAAFLQSIPAEALAALGPWAGPAGAAIATAAAVLGAYAKGDPLRNLGGAVADLGGTTVPVIAPEVEPAPADLREMIEAAPATDDTLTPKADALAAKAAELRHTGSTTSGGGA